MPTAFPEAPPTCYVRPAAGMQVPDGHPFVTRDGLCHLGIVTLSSFESHCFVVWFLARVANVCWSVRAILLASLRGSERAGTWARAPLSTVLQQLVSIFSAHPPVFSVPSTPTTYLSSSSSQTPSQQQQQQQQQQSSLAGTGGGGSISGGPSSISSFRGAGDIDAPPTYQQHVQLQSFSQAGPTIPTTTPQQQQQQQQFQQFQQQQQQLIQQQQQQQQEVARKLQLQQLIQARLHSLEEQADTSQAQLTITQSNLETHAQTLETLERELTEDSVCITHRAVDVGLW